MEVAIRPKVHYMQSGRYLIKCRFGFLEEIKEGFGVLGVYTNDSNVLISPLARNAYQIGMTKDRMYPCRIEYKLILPVLITRITGDSDREDGYTANLFFLSR